MVLEHKETRPSFVAVILAGGSGTRFWPRSRRARAKQVLAIHGEHTMIQQTVNRLEGIVEDEHDIWVITNDQLEGVIGAQLPNVAKDRILCEPASRNTAPASALIAFLLERTTPDAVIGVFPSDHTIEDLARFREVLMAGSRLASAGPNIVVLGVPPTRTETGYGYIELGAAELPVAGDKHAIPVRRVRRFTEKPSVERARSFVRSGNYVWNSGMFLWSARTFADAIREHVPAMAPLLERIAAAWETPEFEKVFAEVYPLCEGISIDYAVLEPRSAKGEAQSGLYCLPADFAWNDLGSWAALHEFVSEGRETENVVEADHQVLIQAQGCYVFAPGKAVALVGVKDLVVVETEDALLITTRDGSQDVGKVVHELKHAGRVDLT
ncbi:MAG TPA: sugar phosphate nucleotidyltransferase [Acidobacteriaceae bacterium]|jgi:mannose-1-phosphate guanylyltransferase